MIEEDDKNLDDLFKKRLQDSENLFAYNEDDWTAMEAKLDKKDQRQAALYWLRIGSGIAAMLLLFFGWLFLYSPVVEQPVVVKKKATNEPARPEVRIVKEKDRAIGIKKEAEQAIIATIDHQSQVFFRNPSQQPVGTNSKKEDQPAITIIDTTKVIAATNNPTINPTSVVVNAEPIATITSVSTVAQPDAEVPETAVEEKSKLKETKRRSITFAVSAIVASDLNGSTSLNDSKVGSNYGALIGINFTRKLTLQTGVIYANKPYNGNPENYANVFTGPYGAKYVPISVDVACKMLDIPLNLDYQIFENRSNKISLGTGLSSYLMLNENYQYNFDPASYYAAKSYLVPDSKAYLFSILNLSATYEYKLSQRFGLTAQPYLKVPLREVGYGDVKLRSTGISLGLKFNFAR